MKKKQKREAIVALKPLLEDVHLYIIDCEELSANQIYVLRHMLYQANIGCKIIPNALLRILITNTPYASLSKVLQKTSMVLFTREDPKEPAKLIKTFRKKEKVKKPTLKGAFVCQELFLGEEQLEHLIKLKTKEELLGEVISVLHAPAYNLISALQQPGNTICTILKTLQQRKN